MTPIHDLLKLCPVIPVLVIDDADHAVPIAAALVAGGLRVLEVTLRTPAALDVIRAMSTVDGAIVGAGTVLNPRDLDDAMKAGAQFIVSPGLTDPLGAAAAANDVPFLPGTASAGDIMRGLDMGLTHFKFFPAEAIGGIKALKAITGPFGAARFCPTGGITQDSAADWLAMAAVLCVGGSWVVPAVPAGVPGGMPDVAEITRRAALAAAL